MKTVVRVYSTNKWILEDTTVIAARSKRKHLRWERKIKIRFPPHGNTYPDVPKLI